MLSYNISYNSTLPPHSIFISINSFPFLFSNHFKKLCNPYSLAEIRMKIDTPATMILIIDKTYYNREREKKIFYVKLQTYRLNFNLQGYCRKNSFTSRIWDAFATEGFYFRIQNCA